MLEKKPKVVMTNFLKNEGIKWAEEARQEAIDNEDVKQFITNTIDLFKTGKVPPIQVKIKKLVPEAVIPTYAKDGDMGMDVTATSVEYDRELDCFVYHTGLAFELPKGYGMLIFPRSSNRKTNCYMANHVGILDSGFRGELLLCFKYKDSVLSILSSFRSDKFIERIANNLETKDIKRLAMALIKTSNDIINDDLQLNDFMANFAPYKVGNRIGQIVIVPYPTVEFEETDTLSESERGANGHGSTGC